MKRFSKNLPSLLATAMPYVCLFAVALMFIITATMGSRGAAERGLLLFGVPAIIASGIAIWKIRSLKQGSIVAPWHLSLSTRSFSKFALIFGILYLVSLYLLIIGETRPLAYFILVAVMAGLIFMEILGVEKEHSGRRGIILAQIVFLLLNVILGQGLKLPLYFGGTDILAHLRLVNLVVESGHVTPDLGLYQNFPLFHIFNASGMLITGIELKTSYFLLSGLAFATVIPLVYLVVSQLTEDSRIPLTAALLYSASQVSMFGGLYIVTRTLAFILSLLVFYLLIRGRNNLQLRIIAVLLTIPLVLMHQTTLVHFSIILAAFIIIELVLYHRSQFISHTYFILFNFVYIAYWVYIAKTFFTTVIKMLESMAEAGAINLPTRPPLETLGMSWAHYADYIILLFFALLGILILLHETRHRVDLGYIAALFSLAAIPLFLPLIRTELFGPMFMLYRLDLFLGVFLAFVMAKGLLLLVDRLSINRQRLKQMAMIGISLIVVILFSFSSLTIAGNSTDLDVGEVIGKENRLYYTQSELVSFSFIADYKDKTPIYTDYQSWAYFLKYLGISMPRGEEFLLGEAEEGYFLFRKQEFESREQLSFLYKEPRPYQARVFRISDAPNIEDMVEGKTKIYDNQAVEIYRLE